MEIAAGIVFVVSMVIIIGTLIVLPVAFVDQMVNGRITAIIARKTNRLLDRIEGKEGGDAE